jgi:hypothetical protein
MRLLPIIVVGASWTVVVLDTTVPPALVVTPPTISLVAEGLRE